MVIDKTVIRDLHDKEGKWRTASPECGNFPKRCFVAISRPEDLLTKIVLSGAQISS